MIDSADAGSITVTSLLKPADHADTAAATGAWTAVSGYEGYLVFLMHVGVVTAGNIVAKIQTASDDQGTGITDLATYTTVTTSNDNPFIEKKVVAAKQNLGYIRFLGTITTGPATVGCEMLGSLKTAA